MDAAKLVRMANQIGQFFASQRHTDAASAIADHLRKFWEPRMRATLIAHLDAGGTGLDGPVRKAVDLLKPNRPLPPEETLQAQDQQAEAQSPES